MFAARYFAPRYFPPRYFPKIGEDPLPVVITPVSLISPLRKIVDQEGVMSNRMEAWVGQVTELQPLAGAGSPEGFFEANQTRFYVDLLGTTGAILYVKRDANIGGDKTKGWIVV